MNIKFLRWSAGVVLAGLFMLLSSGCAVYGGGYGYESNVGIDYYEPFGVDYGGWGPGYRVAPFHDGGGHFDRRGGVGRTHSFRSPPASRGMPSIPHQGRSGGHRSH